jgi:HEAT repeat protein
MAQAAIFISYVRADETKARRLARDLQRAGAQVWLDRTDLRPGTYWKRAIRSAIQSGAFFIACFSEAYLQRSSTYMNEELLVAVEALRQKPMHVAWLIPVRLSAVEVPDYDISPTATLRDLQFVDLFPSWRAGVEQLLATIRPNRSRLSELAEVIAGASSVARLWAIESVGKIGDAEAVELLVRVARERRDEETFDAVIKALGGSRHELAAPGIVEVINQPHWKDMIERSYWFRQATTSLLSDAFQALSKSSELRESVTYAAARGLQHNNEVVRRAAILALSREPFDSNIAADILADHYHSEQNVRLRRILVDALEHLGGEVAVEKLVAIATDMNARTQDATHAIAALGKLQLPELLPMFMSLIPKLSTTNYDERARRDTMILTIGTIGSPSAIPFLEDIIVYEEDGRKVFCTTAQTALIRIGTPEARNIAESRQQRYFREHR